MAQLLKVIGDFSFEKGSQYAASRTPNLTPKPLDSPKALSLLQMKVLMTLFY